MAKRVKEISTYIINFCKFCKIHSDTWRSLIDQSSSINTGLRNLGEQLVYISKANPQIDFDKQPLKDILQHKIQLELEDDLIKVREIIDKLHRVNTELRSRITQLNNATLDLDPNKDNLIIKGSPTVPPLDRLLESSLMYYDYFQSHVRTMFNALQSLDWYRLDTVESFCNSFRIKFDAHQVMYLLALTQYVDNEKDIL